MAGKKTVIKDKAAEVVDYSRNERNNDPGSNTASQLRNNSKSGPHASGPMRLHRWLLYIEPKSAQEQYYGQVSVRSARDCWNCIELLQLTTLLLLVLCLHLYVLS